MDEIIFRCAGKITPCDFLVAEDQLYTAITIYEGVWRDDLHLSVLYL